MSLPRPTSDAQARALDTFPPLPSTSANRRDPQVPRRLRRGAGRNAMRPRDRGSQGLLAARRLRREVISGGAHVASGDFQFGALLGLDSDSWRVRAGWDEQPVHRRARLAVEAARLDLAGVRLAGASGAAPAAPASRSAAASSLMAPRFSAARWPVLSSSRRREPQPAALCVLAPNAIRGLLATGAEPRTTERRGELGRKFCGQHCQWQYLLSC
jgi:hypothetical protein